MSLKKQVTTKTFEALQQGIEAEDKPREQDIIFNNLGKRSFRLGNQH